MSIINNIIGKASLGAASAGASFVKDKWFKDDRDKIAELMAKQQFGDTWNKMSGEARRNSDREYEKERAGRSEGLKSQKRRPAL
jgi:hypothetical protein